MRAQKQLKQLILLFLFFACSVTISLPIKAHAEEKTKVIRIGGDEFTVIVQGTDYQNIDQLIAQVSEHNIEAQKNGGVVIACGMSRYNGDDCVAPVFERADQNMYDNKNDLKTGKNYGSE